MIIIRNPSVEDEQSLASLAKRGNLLVRNSVKTSPLTTQPTEHEDPNLPPPPPIKTYLPGCPYFFCLLTL